jgi:hypothetical protein
VLVATALPVTPSEPQAGDPLAIEPARAPCCPQCGGTRLVHRELPAEPCASAVARDTS